MVDDILAQGLGLIASGLVISGFFFKNDVRLKILIATGGIFFALHFYMLGAYAGMAMVSVSAIRAALSVRFHGSTVVMMVAITLYLGLGYMTYDSMIDLLPVFSGIVGTYGMYKLSGVKLRVALLLSSASWLVYDTIFRSVGGILTELVLQTVNLTTMYRLYRDRRQMRL